jgi:HK97 gp10 family phage protein
MTTRATIGLKGFDAYLEKIVQAGRDVDQAAATAVTAGGDVIYAGMEQRVARDTNLLANTLERGPVQQDGNFIYVEVGMPRNAPADVARYGNAQEYGTSSMAAQPYIRPTFDEYASKVRKAERAALEQAGIL